MVNGSWDVTSPLIEIVGPTCHVLFMHALPTQIRRAKSIPGRLFAYIGTDRVRRVPTGGKTRRNPRRRLRIGRYEDNAALCPAPAATGVRAASRRIRTRAMKT